jgi:hypothetical protein
MRHMGWVRRWEERTDAKDRDRRQLELKQDQLRLQEDSLRRAIPVEPIMGPDKTPVTVSVRASGSSLDVSGGSGDVYGFGIAIEMLAGLVGFVSWLRYRGGYAVWLRAPGRRTAKYRHGSELEALTAVAGVVYLVRTTGASGVGLKKARWFMRRRRRP